MNCFPDNVSSDQNLKRRLLSTLLARQVPGLLTIRINVQHGVVLVQGSLPSAQARRLCLECTRHVAGVMDLKEELTIDDEVLTAAPKAPIL
jgi:osmotically-inducible protein OsmY